MGEDQLVKERIVKRRHNGKVGSWGGSGIILSVLRELLLYLQKERVLRVAITCEKSPSGDSVYVKYSE